MYPNEANLVCQIVQRHNQRHDRGILPLSAGFKPQSLGSQSSFQMEKSSEHFRHLQVSKKPGRRTGGNMELNFNASPEKPAVTRIRTGVAAATTAEY